MNKFESEKRFAERMKRCYPPGTRLVLLIELEDGTQLYQSSHVPPGNEIRKINLSQPLPKGTYTAYVSILTNEINTGTPMNSAKTKITINVI